MCEAIYANNWQFITYNISHTLKKVVADRKTVM